MKKFLLLVCFSSFISSELILEITQGTEDPFRVAIIKFNGDNKAAIEIDQIIKNNLMRSGEFKIFDNDDLLSLPKDEDEIVFNDL